MSQLILWLNMRPEAVGCSSEIAKYAWKKRVAAILQHALLVLGTRALAIILKCDDLYLSSKANTLVYALRSSEFIVSLFTLCEVAYCLCRYLPNSGNL